MKRFLFAVTAVSLISFVSCDKLSHQSPLSPANTDPVPVKVGVMTDSTEGNEYFNGNLKKLFIRVSARNEQSMTDSFPIVGDVIHDNYVEIFNTYYLKPFKTWTVEGYVTDINDSVTHSGKMLCPVDQYGDDMLIMLNPNFCVLQTAFYPLSKYPSKYGEITRCEVVLDKKCVVNTPDQYIFDDTVRLEYNYVRLERTHQIVLNVYGYYFGKYMPLYASDTITHRFTSFGNEQTIPITLKWVGPDTIPPSLRVMDAVILPFEHFKIQGKIDIPPVH